MARRNRAKRRVRRFSGRVRRRLGGSKIPFEMLIGAGTIPFTPAADGWNTPLNYASSGDYDGLMSSMKKGFLGMNPDGRVDFLSTINPFDLGNARYTKTLIYSALIGKIRKRFVPQSSKLVSKIPVVGRWVN
jgi:hypothetical protein